MTPEFIMQMVVQVGLCGALVVWFVWRSDKREADMSERIRALETQQFEKVVKIAEENKTVVAENTAAIRELTSTLETCPCGKA